MLRPAPCETELGLTITVEVASDIVAVPGLKATVNVQDGQALFVTTHGAAFSEPGYGDSVVLVAVDGASTQDYPRQRIVTNTTVENWSVSGALFLPAGSHVIEVYVARMAGTATFGGYGPAFGELTLLTLSQ